MAHDSKTPRGDGPRAGEKLVFPHVRADDAEDVSWALSTAEAMWNRGDHLEAVKWIRRAAEAASECEADERHLELAKAAAELASQLDAGERMTTVAPPPVAGVPSSARQTPQTPPSSMTPNAPGVKPGNPQSIPPPLVKRTLPLQSQTPPPVAVTVKEPFAHSPTAPRVAQGPAPSSRREGAGPLRPAEPRTSRRRSHANLGDEARGAKSARAAAVVVDPDTTAEIHVPVIAPEPRKRGRSKPVIDDEPPSTVIPSDLQRIIARSDDPDAWPTQSFSGEDMDDMVEEHTRIGTSAYVEKAIAGSQIPPRMEPFQPAVKPSQAVRVVVWRDNEGVRVAPLGTKVSAIAVEAVLVALDPTADLAAWLTKK